MTNNLHQISDKSSICIDMTGTPCLLILWYVLRQVTGTPCLLILWYVLRQVTGTPCLLNIAQCETVTHVNITMTVPTMQCINVAFCN